MKKILSFIIIIVFTFSLLVSCSTKEKPSNLETVKLSEVVRSIFYAPMYASISEGFFKEEGLNIELSTSQGADKTVQEVLSGNSDIGFCGPEQLVYLYNQGRDDFGTIFAQLTQMDGSFLVSKDNKEFRWDDVKGKTIIGGRPGGVPEMALEHVLRKNGIEPFKDVNIITNLAFNATAGAFKTGTGDYISSFEPTANLLEKENVGKVVKSIGEEAGEICYTSFFSTKKYISENKDTVQKFTNAIYKGQLWVQKTPSIEVAKSIVSFFPGSNEEDLAKIIDRYQEIGAFSKTPIVSESGLNNLFDVIEGYNKDLIKKRPSPSEILTNEFSKKSVGSIDE